MKLDVTAEIATERRYLQREILAYTDRLDALPKIEGILARLAELPAMQDVAGLFLGVNKIDLTLQQPESFLPRQIVREFGVGLKKSAAWDKQSLTCEGEIEGITLLISRYKPASCRIVEEQTEVDIARQVKVMEDGRVLSTKTTRRIVCEPEEVTSEMA